MSKAVIAFGAALIAGFFAVGFWSQAQDNGTSFFKCMVGAAFVAVCLCIGAFIQRLNKPLPRQSKAGAVSLRRKAEELANANPQVPALRHLYVWLILGFVVTILLRLGSLFL